MPIALVASVPFVLIVNPSLPVPAGELVKLAKEKPGQLEFGSAASPATDFYMELLQTMTGTKMVHIPYKGTAQAIVDVVAGRVPILMSDVAPAAPLIKAGTVRASAFVDDAPRRHSGVRRSPTMACLDSMRWPG